MKYFTPLEPTGFRTLYCSIGLSLKKKQEKYAYHQGLTNSKRFIPSRKFNLGLFCCTIHVIWLALNQIKDNQYLHGKKHVKGNRTIKRLRRTYAKQLYTMYMYNIFHNLFYTCRKLNSSFKLFFISHFSMTMSCNVMIF